MRFGIEHKLAQLRARIDKLRKRPEIEKAGTKPPEVNTSANGTHDGDTVFMDYATAQRAPSSLLQEQNAGFPDTEFLGVPNPYKDTPNNIAANSNRAVTKPPLSIAEQRAADHADFAKTVEMGLDDLAVTHQMPLDALPDRGVHVSQRNAQAPTPATAWKTEATPTPASQVSAVQHDGRSLFERAMDTRAGDDQLTRSVMHSPFTGR